MKEDSQSARSIKVADAQATLKPVLIDEPDKVSRLVARIRESTRGDASLEKIGRFVQPAPGALVEAMSRQHHIVFGRRGSGKTSLLRKAESDLLARGNPVAFVDLDVYDGQTFPNLVASILRDALLQYRGLAEKLPDDKRRRQLVALLDEEINELVNVVSAPDEAKALRDVIQRRHNKQKRGIKGGFSIFNKLKLLGIFEQGRESTSEHAQKLEYATNKQDLIYNHIGFYKETLKAVSKAFDADTFLILDELYHIPQRLQPLVLDYFHSLVRNSRVWMKIGTVKYRSRLLMRTADGSRGIELKQDAQPINLDASFEWFSQTERFLVQILDTFVKEAELDSVADLATEKAIERLVQASGGVARDFLQLFVDSVAIASERLAKAPSKLKRIVADDVWDAAARFNSERRSEFNSDVRLQVPDKLTAMISSIRDFCYSNAMNCILIQENTSGELRSLIDEIWDCKLLHTVKTGLWVGGQQHTAFMLDVSEQASDWNMRRIIVDLGQEDAELKAELSQQRHIFGSGQKDPAKTINFNHSQ